MNQDAPSAVELIDKLDREDGPLGPRHTWSPHFEGLLGLLRASRQPMHLIWGEEGILIYNDAYCPILLDKHPWAMGQPFRDVFPEFYRDRLRPMAEAAMAGESLIATDIKTNVNRRGYLEEVWLTVSLTPIPNQEGVVEGIFAIVLETTDRSMESRRTDALEGLSRVMRRSKTPDDMMRLGAPRIGTAIGAEMIALCNLSRKGHLARVRKSWVAPGFPVMPPEIDLRQFGPDIANELRAGRRVGVTDLAPVEEDARRGSIVDKLGLRSFLMAPVFLEEELHGIIIAADSASRQWLATEGQLLQECADLLSIHVDRKVKMDQMAASERWHRAMIEASPHLLWMWNDEAEFGYLNDAWLNYTGLKDHRLRENIYDFLHPDELQPLLEMWGVAKQKDKPARWRARYRRHDGVYRWFDVYAKPYRDDKGSRVWFGTSTDINDLVEAEEELKRLKGEQG